MQRCLAAASGAAFSAVVIGQAANAFACRSTTRPAWSMRRSPNPRLRIAVAVALLILVGSLGVPPVARLLRQAPPTPAGLAVAMSAAPAILSIDALTKWFGRRRARRDRTARDPTPRAVPVP
jgi:magnesium-transporting ATPase (P-type)